MKNTCRRSLCLAGILFLGLSGVLVAEEPMQALFKIGPGARAYGMACSFSAIADDVSCLYWNPAGLGHLKKAGIMINEQQWVADISFVSLYAAYPLGKAGVVGISGQRLFMKGFRLTDSLGNELDKLAGVSGTVVSAGYGYGLDLLGIQPIPGIINDIDAGVTVSLVRQELDDTVFSRIVLEYGVLFREVFKAFDLAVVKKDAGVVVGGSLPVYVKSVRTMNMDADITFMQAKRVLFSAGLEYRLLDWLFLRCGYRMGNDSDGPHFGAGVKKQIGTTGLGFDYAFSMLGSLGTVHNFTLTLEF